MLMSSGGLVACSSGCATRPRAREVGSTGYTMPTQYSLLIGRYVMATAEHREPCDSRGSCTVLGAPEGEIPPGDSTGATVPPFSTSCLVEGLISEVLGAIAVLARPSRELRIMPMNLLAMNGLHPIHVAEQ